MLADVDNRFRLACLTEVTSGDFVISRKRSLDEFSRVDSGVDYLEPMSVSPSIALDYDYNWLSDILDDDWSTPEETGRCSRQVRASGLTTQGFDTMTDTTPSYLLPTSTPGSRFQSSASSSPKPGQDPRILRSSIFKHDPPTHQHPEDTPKYSTRETNLFTHMLSTPIPWTDEEREQEYARHDILIVLQPITTPDNYMESPSDEHLPGYFARKYGPDSGTIGFSSVYGTMYVQLGRFNPVLRHACLAVASFWAGRKTGQTFSNRSEAHITFLLPELRRVIQSGQFDDGHLCAVYLLMSLAWDTNRFRVMQNHGQGLAQMLRHRGYLREHSNKRYVLVDHAPPLIAHIWRLALRDDIMCGFGGPGYYKMCLPAMEMREEPYERCMSHFLDTHRPHLKSIKRELLRKDLLTHRLLHLQNQISEYRRSPEYHRDPAHSERTFRQMGWALIHDISLQRDRITTQYRRNSPAETVYMGGRFLDYAPFYTNFYDSYVLFISNSHAYINATFLIDEKLGRSEKCPERTTAAIDLCRAVVARGKQLKALAIPLCFAGLAFIGDFPRGKTPSKSRLVLLWFGLTDV